MTNRNDGDQGLGLRPPAQALGSRMSSGQAEKIELKINCKQRNAELHGRFEMNHNRKAAMTEICGISIMGVKKQ